VILRRRVVAPCALLGLAVGLAACGGSTTAALPPAPPEVLTSPLPKGTDTSVERVVDGDTLVTAGGTRVRLIGVDTPETVKPDSPVECFGPEASAATKALLHPGTRIRLVPDLEAKDRYGRDLAYVYRSSDGLFVAGYLAREGFARPLSIRPNVAHRADLARWSAAAKAGRLGLWSRCS
jgi:micrococcal nuclease